MGKIVVTEFMTLDGVIQDPGGSDGTRYGGWSFRYPTPDGQQFKFNELLNGDAQLLGRVTYEGFAAAWPGMEEQTGEFGRMMNEMPKYVVSTTLGNASWTNTTIIPGDVVNEVNNLKQKYRKDILVSGSATLVGTLRQHDLIDEYHLMVHPIVLGTGKRLFPDGTPPGDLVLVESSLAGPDVLLLVYRPAERHSASAGASDTTP
jgi:dihydrofolate reductase